MKLTKTKNLLNLTIIIIGSLSYFSCKKKEFASTDPSNASTTNQGAASFATPASGVTPDEIQRQLQWIASSLPIIAHRNATFKSTMHSQISSAAGNFKYNYDLQTALTSVLNYNNIVESEVDSNFTPNNYDSSYFYGFYFEDCLYKTLVQIPDAELISNYSTKPLLAAAIFETNSDTLMGYFWNTGTNNIDSVLVTMEDADNYYIWIVTADNMCLEAKGLSGPAPDVETCGNGKCEPFLGETPANCVDCMGANAPAAGKYTLYLEEFQHLTDKYWRNPADAATCQELRFHESYFSGRYDLVYQYAIIDATNPSALSAIDGWSIANVTTPTFKRDKYWDNNGNRYTNWQDILLGRLKIAKASPDIQRCKSRYSSGHFCNTSTLPSANYLGKVLCYNFIPSVHKIITDFHEFDRKHSVYNHNYTGPGGLNLNFRFRYGGGNPSKMHYIAGTSNEGLSFNHPTWISSSALYGPGSYYFDIDKNVYTPGAGCNITDVFVGCDQSEMRVRYVIRPN